MRRINSLAAWASGCRPWRNSGGGLRRRVAALRGTLSEETCSVIHSMMRKCARRAASGFQIGKDWPGIAAGGRAAGTFSALLAVDPLEQDVQQQVTSKNTNRQKHSQRHTVSPSPARIPRANNETLETHRLKSPERIMRNSLGSSLSKTSRKYCNVGGNSETRLGDNQKRSTHSRTIDTTHHNV
jgi:hypothetical protein